MRQRIMIGILVALLIATGYVIYRNATAESTTVASAPSRGTIRVALDDEDLGKLQALSPKLTLRADDGGQTPVLVWKVDRGQVVMQQFANLRPALYTTLLADFENGQTETLLIDVDLRPRP